MIEVDKCRLEPDKDRRVAQILATDVTREQLAEAVWSMERTHAVQHDLIMELMDSCNHLKDRNYELRELVRDIERARKALCDELGHIDLACDDCPAWPICDTLYDRMRELGIEVTP